MSSVKEYQEELKSYETARYIVGAFRDISAIDFRTYRARFEQNSTLYRELTELFQIITRIAEQEGKHYLPTRDPLTLYVAYTSNKHFYGSVNQDIMNVLFSRTGSADRVLIIGETGRNIWNSAPKKRKEISFLTFKNDMPNEQESKNFLQSTARYGRVIVLYPGWVNVFKQNVEQLDITFRDEIKSPHDAKDMPQYILEPEIMQMFSFFDSQVRYVLFERMLLETQLSRVSARLVRMDAADENAQELIKKGHIDLHKAQADFSDTRLMETFSGYVQWHKKTTHSVQ